ncbi:hypothetical protein H8356DRAFT_1327079 [Neocallimastix lanati (nom. inval.)]|nr:hypothetical protein H8356DRAFT_1327079 [Neocallimastix sp. JGI-2020a]
MQIYSTKLQSFWHLCICQRRTSTNIFMKTPGKEVLEKFSAIIGINKVRTVGDNSGFMEGCDYLNIPTAPERGI